MTDDPPARSPQTTGGAATAAVDAGPDAEFSAFYRESVPRLVAFLRYMGAPYAVAADCVQDTMVKALPPVWGTLTHPYTWCRTTCTRLYLRHVERNREHPVADVGDAGNPLISPGVDLDALEERSELVRAIQSLPPRRRQVVAYVLDEVPYPEIAAALDMSPATVRTTYRDAKRELAGLLRRSGGAAR